MTIAFGVELWREASAPKLKTELRKAKLHLHVRIEKETSVGRLITSVVESLMTMPTYVYARTHEQTLRSLRRLEHV